jgi:hypothetical protein
MKTLIPDPLFMILSADVGPVLVDQQTPLAVKFSPPSSVTFPPDVAVVSVISDTLVVAREGRVGPFLQEKHNIVNPIPNDTIPDTPISRFMIVLLIIPQVIIIKVTSIIS